MSDLVHKGGFSSIEDIIRDKLGLPPSDSILTEIIDISREIPNNINALIPTEASFLSGRFLKGLDLCGELYSIAIAYELKMEVNKKKEHGLALILRSKKHGFKTAKEKEAYANTDDVYIEASDRHAESKMFRVRVESMRKDFEKAHYLMRKVSEEDSDTEASSVSETAGGWRPGNASNW